MVGGGARGGGSRMRQWQHGSELVGEQVVGWGSGCSSSPNTRMGPVLELELLELPTCYHLVLKSKIR